MWKYLIFNNMQNTGNWSELLPSKQTALGRLTCSVVSPDVTFEKVTVTFFVTFFSRVFPNKNPENDQMLLCYLFWKGMPSAPSHTPTPALTPSLQTLTPSIQPPPARWNLELGDSLELGAWSLVFHDLTP